MTVTFWANYVAGGVGILVKYAVCLHASVACCQFVLLSPTLTACWQHHHADTLSIGTSCTNAESCGSYLDAEQLRWNI